MSSPEPNPGVVCRQLEEFNLLRCSLLQGEQLIFVPPSSPDAETWEALLHSYADFPELDSIHSLPRSAARIRVGCNDSPVWFEAEIPMVYGGPDAKELLWDHALVVRGDQITRAQQEYWKGIIKECADDISQDSEYPIFELISTHLLPRLHAEAEAAPLNRLEGQPAGSSTSASHPSSANFGLTTHPIFHALLTSHHLISPSKRRSLQLWSSQLRIHGFAKIGSPGIIYCEGQQKNVEEFVANIKVMQWLALRVRFLEPLPAEHRGHQEEKRPWVEFDKVGEVVQEMKRMGRESFVIEMGIGSVGSQS